MDDFVNGVMTAIPVVALVLASCLTTLNVTKEELLSRAKEGRIIIGDQVYELTPINHPTRRERSRKMKIELLDILTLIEKKTSWGKNELKEAILAMIAEKA